MDSRFSLLYLLHGLLFLAQGRSSSLYDPVSPQPVIEEGGEPLNLGLELVKGQGGLLCFGVEERPDRRVGSGIEIRIGAIEGSLRVLHGLGCARALSLGLYPDTTDRAPGFCGFAATDGFLCLLLDLLRLGGNVVPALV